MTVFRDQLNDRPRRLLAVGVVVLAVKLPFLAFAAGGRVIDKSAAVGTALTEPAVERIARASGIPPALEAAIRGAVPEGGRLVLYSPYGGAEFELDAEDPRGAPARLVRTLFERVKNLLYPTPRDVHFARDADELRQKLAPEFAGRLFVLDGTQQPVALAVGGDWQLVHDARVGGAGRLRLWRFVQPR
ncbi:MAG: hypothetical protein KDE27_25980 [Planctomycetes bacterium]|nr:hypothetical protein [Planctomycetota bacterium]